MFLYTYKKSFLKSMLCTKKQDYTAKMIFVLEETCFYMEHVYCTNNMALDQKFLMSIMFLLCRNVSHEQKHVLRVINMLLLNTICFLCEQCFLHRRDSRAYSGLRSAPCTHWRTANIRRQRAWTCRAAPHGRGPRQPRLSCWTLDFWEWLLPATPARAAPACSRKGNGVCTCPARPGGALLDSLSAAPALGTVLAACARAAPHQHLYSSQN